MKNRNEAKSTNLFVKNSANSKAIRSKKMARNSSEFSPQNPNVYSLNSTPPPSTLPVGFYLTFVVVFRWEAKAWMATRSCGVLQVYSPQRKHGYSRSTEYNCEIHEVIYWNESLCLKILPE